MQKEVLMKSYSCQLYKLFGNKTKIEIQLQLKNVDLKTTS